MASTSSLSCTHIPTHMSMYTYHVNTHPHTSTQTEELGSTEGVYKRKDNMRRLGAYG